MSDREADQTVDELSTENGELPEGWATATVKEVSTAIQYGYTASASRDIDGPRFLRITDRVSTSSVVIAGPGRRASRS